MKFLCKLGFHKWVEFFNLHEVNSKKGCSKKRCQRCGVTHIITSAAIEVALKRRSKK